MGVSNSNLEGYVCLCELLAQGDDARLLGSRNRDRIRRRACEHETMMHILRVTEEVKPDRVRGSVIPMRGDARDVCPGVW
jgi:hypothetical protein